MSLSDELHSVLTKIREHVAGLVNSGMLVTIDSHLDQLAAAAENGIQAADDAAKGLLLEAYTALHGSPPVEAAPEPTVDVPAEPVQDQAPAEAPAAEQPAGETVIVGESGPEIDLPAQS